MRITKSQLRRIIKEEVEKSLFDFAGHLKQYAVAHPELQVWTGSNHPWADPEPGIEDLVTIGFRKPATPQQETFVSLYREVYPDGRTRYGVGHQDGNDDVPETSEEANALLTQMLYPDAGASRAWDENPDF